MGWLSVAWARAGSPSTAERLAVAEVALRCGQSDSQVRLGRLCPGCGSHAHGRPYVVPWSPHRPPGVSLSRTDGFAVVAVAGAQSVGVDVEKVAAFRDAGVAGVLLHSGEHADRPDGLARTWVRKEALLKAAGSGLATDPATVRVSDPDERPRVVHWPDAVLGPAPAWLIDLDLADDVCAAVAGTGAAPVEVSVRQVAGEGPGG